MVELRRLSFFLVKKRPINQSLTMSSGQRRVKWTKREDMLLENSVRMHGSSNWVLVASELKETNRTGKQCRERWVNHLCPGVRQGSWTAEEDYRLLQIVKVYGSQWAMISMQFSGRSPNSVKNRWRTLTQIRERIKMKSMCNIVEFYEKNSHLQHKTPKKKKPELPPIDDLPFPYELAAEDPVSFC